MKTEDVQAELARVDKVFQSYFDGIAGYDYQSMRQACSAGYLLFEDGTVWTVEDHVAFLMRIPVKKASVPGIESHLVSPRLRRLRECRGGFFASRGTSFLRGVVAPSRGCPHAPEGGP